MAGTGTGAVPPMVPDVVPGIGPVIEKGGSAPHFLENKGQLGRDDILFYLPGNPSPGASIGSVEIALFDGTGRSYSYVMTFQGARLVVPVGEDMEGGYYNFLTGRDIKGRTTGVRSFGSVLYRDLYDGIDLVLKAGGDGPKYDLIVRPGANPSVIAIEYTYIDGLKVSEDGALEIRTPFGTVTEESPITVQDGGVVPSSFVLQGPFQVGFSVGPYDKTRDLVIDPLMKYCTYLGGWDSWWDGETTKSEPFLYQGDLIVAGYSDAYNFPITSGVVDTYINNTEAFVTRMTSDLGSLVWSTFLGGDQRDLAYDLQVDGSGNVYITGTTQSLDLPVTAGAFNTTSGIYTATDEWGWTYTTTDAFASKISSDGMTLLYSTYLGGKGNDTGYSITVNSAGNAFVGGSTDSTDFPTKGAYMSSFTGYMDGFVLELDTRGSSLVYSTYLGGSDQWEDAVYDIELDSGGSAIVLGHTSATDFPVTSGAYNTAFVWDMPFITKFSKDGSSLVFSTFLFQETYEEDMSIHEDEVYVTGYTSYSSFPATKDAYDGAMDGWSDTFVSIISSDGARLVYATLLGGSEYEESYHIMVRSTGEMVVTGYTSSSNFPVTKDTYKATIDGYADTFITQFRPDRKALEFSTFFGASSEEYGMGSVFTGPYELCIYGYTYSSDLPTTSNAYSRSFNGGSADLFLAAFKTNSYSPGRPLALSIERGNGMLNLSWAPPLHDGNETIVRYSIYRSLNNASFDLLDSIVYGSTFYVDLGLENGKKYYYYLTATNIVGEGLPSEVVMGSPITVPSMPLSFELRKGNGFIELSWDYPTDDGGDPYVKFNIYSGMEAASLALTVEGFDGTLYNFTGLKNGIIYFYRVNAASKGGEGPGTVVLSAYPSTVPSPPLNLTTVRGDRFIHLFWDAPIDLGGESGVRYNVYYSTNNVSFTRTATGLTANEYNITAIDNGILFYFRVTATNIRGEGPAGSTMEDRAIGRPSGPRELQVTIGDRSAHLEWLAPDSMGGDVSVHYRVYAGAGIYEMMLRADQVTGLECVVEGLTNGEMYYFSVSAVNSLYEGPMSLFVTGVSMRPPSVPQGLEVAPGDSKITVSWSPPSDLGGDLLVTYEIFFGTNIDVIPLSVTTEVPNHQYTSLKNGRTYYIKVRARNQAGPGNFTDVMSAVPMGVPTAPVSLIVARGDGSLNVSWTRPLELGGALSVRYTVYLGNASRSISPIASDVNGTTYLIAGLANGVVYQVAVAAVNPAGEGAFSNTVEGTPMTFPGAPTFVIVAGDAEVNITWSLPANNGGGRILEVRIYRAVGDNELSAYRTVPASAGSFTDGNLENGETYRYALSCINEVGEGPRSEEKGAEPSSSKEASSLSGVVLIVVSVVFLLLAGAVFIFLVFMRKKAPPVQPAASAPPLQGGQYPDGSALPPAYAPGLPGTYQYGLPPALGQADVPAQQDYYPPAVPPQQTTIPVQGMEYGQGQIAEEPLQIQVPQTYTTGADPTPPVQGIEPSAPSPPPPPPQTPQQDQSPLV